MGEAVVVSTATAGLGWVVYLVAGGLGAGAPLAGGAAAAVIGGLSQLVAGRLRVPSLAVTTTGIVPLLPGLTVYRGLFELVHGGNVGMNTAIATLLQAAAIGMGLAAGVSLGTFVARPWSPSSTAGNAGRSPLGRDVRQSNRAARRHARDWDGDVSRSGCDART